MRDKDAVEEEDADEGVEKLSARSIFIQGGDEENVCTASKQEHELEFIAYRMTENHKAQGHTDTDTRTPPHNSISCFLTFPPHTLTLLYTHTHGPDFTRRRPVVADDLVFSPIFPSFILRWADEDEPYASSEWRI